MSSLYKNSGVWYVSVFYKGKRISKSLKTKEYSIAKQLESETVYQLIHKLKQNNNESLSLSFSEVVHKYLNTEHGWAKNTRILYTNVLKSHLANKPLPTNPSSRAIHIRSINTCWKWGLKNNLIDKAYFIPGDTKGESRSRVYTKAELDTMFQEIVPDSFNAFVHFAYYTGARSGEIRLITSKSTNNYPTMCVGVLLTQHAPYLLRNEDNQYLE